jgi:FkbM family methyltransferase
LFVKQSCPEFAVLGRAVEVLASHGLYQHGLALIDVGANIGTTSIAAVRQHGFARSVAFEPDPECARLLRVNAELNGISGQVEVIAAAVSADARSSLFVRGDRNGAFDDGGGSLWDRGPLLEEAIAVPTTTLSEEMRRLRIEPGDVGLLWVDVQGHESQVLAAGGALVKYGVPIVAAVRAGKADHLALIATLSNSYGSFVDLRAPNIYAAAWVPVDRLLSDLVQVRPLHTTDVLFVPKRPLKRAIAPVA